jgi:hypothetical protein
MVSISGVFWTFPGVYPHKKSQHLRTGFFLRSFSALLIRISICFDVEILYLQAQQAMVLY